MHKQQNRDILVSIQSYLNEENLVYMAPAGRAKILTWTLSPRFNQESSPCLISPMMHFAAQNGISGIGIRVCISIVETTLRVVSNNDKIWQTSCLELSDPDLLDKIVKIINAGLICVV